MNKVNYNPNLEPWYSPKKILQAAQLLGRTYGTDFLTRGDFQRAREMLIGAIATIGAYKLSTDNKYLIQLNNQSATPDVMSGVLIEEPGKKVTLAHTPLEIVELEEHSTDTDLFEFVKKTKLPPAKKYENTMILCFVNKDLPHQDLQEMILRFKAEKPDGSVFFLGRASSTDTNLYKIMTPYPTPSPWVEFDVVQTAYSYEMPDSVMMQRGSAKEITVINSRKEPFKIYEAMGVNKAKVEKYRK